MSHLDFRNFEKMRDDLIAERKKNEKLQRDKDTLKDVVIDYLYEIVAAKQVWLASAHSLNITATEYQMRVNDFEMKIYKLESALHQVKDQ